MNLKWITSIWEFINKLSPETRSLLIILLFGYIGYTQIEDSTRKMIENKHLKEVICNKKAEKYSMEASAELNNQVLLIAKKDKEAFDVILMNYHNNSQSLQGYKYLYLSCLTEAPRDLDTPLIGKLWNKIDYIYYADELSKIHSQNFVYIDNVEKMGDTFPKLYRLIKASDAKAVAFFTIEGRNSSIGMIIILFKESHKPNYSKYKNISPHIQKLAILLDYENIKK